MTQAASLGDVNGDAEPIVIGAEAGGSTAAAHLAALGRPWFAAPHASLISRTVVA